MNKKEENIKKALDLELPEWNDNMVWDKIEDELHPKRDRKSLLWFFIGSFICLTVLGAILFSKSDKTTDAKQLSSNNNAIVDRAQAALENMSENQLVNQALTKTVSQELKTQATTPSEQVQVQDAPVASTLSKKPLSIKPQQSITTNSTTTKSATTILPQKNETNRNNDLPNALNVNKISTAPRLVPEETVRNLMTFLDPLASKTLSLSSLQKSDDTANLILEYDMNLATAIQPVVEPIGSLYQVQFRSGLYYTFRVLSESGAGAWLEQKNEVDTPLESFDLSLSLRRELSKNFSITAGIGYNQTVELLTSRDTSITTRLITKDTAVIITHNLGDQYLAGELTEKTTQTSTSKTPNRLRAVTLPINLNYSMQKGNWGLELSGGADINLSSWFEGKILDYDQTVILFTSEDQDYFNFSTVIANINLEAAISYATNERLSFTLGTKFKHGLHDYLTSQAHSMKYNLMGLNFSTMYRL